MADKIFLEKIKGAYFVARGESHENAKKFLAFWQNRQISFDKDEGRFRGGYEGVAIGAYVGTDGEPWHVMRRYARPDEVKAMLFYVARRTARRIAEKQELEFKDLTRDRDFIEDTNDMLEELVKRCGEGMNEERARGDTVKDVGSSDGGSGASSDEDFMPGEDRPF